LQKWRFSGGTWQYLYTLTNGLNFNQPYSVAGLDSSLNPVTVGLRNITGKVNGDGTVTVFAITSADSAMADPGASPNKLVSITDDLAATSLPAVETFTTLKSAGFGERLSGVSFAPFNSPIDVTSQVSVRTGNIICSRATRLCTGTLTVTNTGQATITGPFAVSLANLTAGVTLVNAGGTYNGAPYVTSATQSLAPGQSSGITVQFGDPSNVPIKFNPVTYRSNGALP